MRLTLRYTTPDMRCSDRHDECVGGIRYGKNGYLQSALIRAFPPRLTALTTVLSSTANTMVSSNREDKLTAHNRVTILYTGTRQPAY